ncbi:MAG TPA: hypothetical protein VGS41_07170, partial [Chthonomonadales bacterium]|nr:hypothetical protein [Chthonomonadales bacterium]
MSLAIKSALCACLLSSVAFRPLPEGTRSKALCLNRTGVSAATAIRIAQASDSRAAGELVVDVRHPGAKTSPMLYGLMTEEINHAYDGGLYGELIQNRAFKDDRAEPVHWSLANSGGAAASITLDRSQPLSKAIDTSLRINVNIASPDHPAAVANDGFWGIPLRQNTRYKAALYARCSQGYSGGLTVSLQSSSLQRSFASARTARLTDEWKRYTFNLTTGRLDSSSTNRFVIAADHPGTVWITLVSLFPPTYHNRVNGNRPDIMRLLAAMQPAFLRLPGGNYLEGNS